MGSKRIGDIVELIRGNTYKSALLNQPGPFLLGLASIAPHGGFREDKLKTYGGPSAEKHLLYPGDLFVSLKDITQQALLLGAVARVPETIKIGRITQDTVKLKFISDSYPKALFYWALRTPEYREYCNARALGTTNLSLSRDDFLNYRLPEITSTNTRLAEILEEIETKITLNRQINQTLEQMAQTLFKSWFVDFDPVIDNALDAGNDIPDTLQERAEQRRLLRAKADFKPLPAATRALFPSEFEETELGWVPKGWEVESLDQIANFQNGLALQKFRPLNDSDDFLPVLKISDLRQGYTDGVEKARTDIVDSCRVYDGDMIFSWSGTLMIDVWTGGNAALNQHLYKVTSQKYPLSFYLYWTKHHLRRFQHIAAAKAVTMGHIKKGDLSDSMCLIPNKEILKKYNDLVSNYTAQQINLRLQNNQLSEIRNSLLPKLISGELVLDDLPEIPSP